MKAYKILQALFSHLTVLKRSRARERNKLISEILLGGLSLGQICFYFYFYWFYFPMSEFRKENFLHEGRAVYWGERSHTERYNRVILIPSSQLPKERNDRWPVHRAVSWLDGD